VIHDGRTKHFLPQNPDNIYALFRYNDKKTVGLFINPNNHEVELEMDRFIEIVGDRKKYFDVIDESTNTLQDKLLIKEMSFRLIEIEKSL
tara:strand:- start:374 stop:643 length:270 start_codon:yes stop_codon:yes gene_type:complete